MAMTQEPERATEEAAPSPTVPDAAGADLERRNFFRTFSREAFQTAATVVGAASAVRKGTTAAAVELLGLGIDPEAGADRLAGALTDGGIGGRSPYRLDGDRILVLDQRRLPGEMIEAVCTSGAEVAGLIREGAVGPGPVLGPLAAYALAMTADRNVASRPFVRSATLRGTANALRNARPDSAALDMALTRVAAAWVAVRAEATDAADANAGAAIAAAIRGEADAIAMESMVGLSRLVEHGVAALPQPVDRPLEVVTIGATGPLSSGVVGTAIGILAAIAAAGRPIHAWVLEGRPGRAGARIGAAELAASDVPATVIADGAIGWLFREHPIDAVLVGADWIAANGDVANVTGTCPLAVMALRHDVPVYVCAPRFAVSERKTTGNALSVIMRGRHELLEMPGEAAAEGIDARVPLSDVTPAELVTGYITDIGLVQAPFAPAGAPAGAPEDLVAPIGSEDRVTLPGAPEDLVAPVGDPAEPA
jgi:methylthioribose-1-phosphate isomerase